MSAQCTGRSCFLFLWNTVFLLAAFIATYSPCSDGQLGRQEAPKPLRIGEIEHEVGFLIDQALGYRRAAQQASQAILGGTKVTYQVDFREPQCQDSNHSSSTPCNLSLDVRRPVLLPGQPDQWCDLVLMPWLPFPCSYNTTSGQFNGTGKSNYCSNTTLGASMDFVGFYNGTVR